jgi:DegV family protein with EDD domain
MIKIITDSTSDIPVDIAQRLAIGIVPVVIVIDGVSHVDGVTLSREQFYASLDKYRDIPMTAAPAVEAFANAFRSAHAEGADEIIAIHLNRRFSALCSVADIAAREVEAEGIRVHVVDSMSLSMALGWLVISAAQMAQSGITAPEIIRRINAMRTRTYVYALVDSLQYLRKSGRASALTAGIGEMLGIKVLLRIHDSEVLQIDRIRTRTRGLARLIEVAHQHRRLENLTVLYTNSDMSAEVLTVQSQCADLMPVEQQYALQVTPVIGAHVGPLAIGISVFADV